MATALKEKSELIEQHKIHKEDTGSAPIQIALLTERINHLTGHLKENKKDFSSRRGLIMMVGKRSSLLKYLKRTDPAKYQETISSLGLRK